MAFLMLLRFGDDGDDAASLNELWRQLKKHNMEDEFQWSVIDRWNTHPLFIESIAQKIRYDTARS
jgi:ferrochelatase